MKILFLRISVQDARIQRSSALPPEESIAAPGTTSRKDFRDVKRNHLPLESLDILHEEADEEMIELTTMPESNDDVRSQRLGMTVTVAPAFAPSLRVLASVEPRLPMPVCSRVHFPSLIMEEAIEEESEEEEEMQQPAVRCKSLESLREMSTSPAVEVGPPRRSRRSRSLNDLCILKAEMESEIVQKSNMFYTPIMRRLKASPRHCSSLISSCKLESISKEEVFVRWKESERELLNVLQSVLREKRALEERLLLLHRVVLLKPP